MFIEQVETHATVNVVALQGFTIDELVAMREAAALPAPVTVESGDVDSGD